MKVKGKLLVTGAAGFIGNAFAEAMHASGADLVLCDRLTHFKDRPELEFFPDTPKVDRERLFEWLGEKGESIGAVVHLGACSKTTEFDRRYLHEMNVEYSQKLWSFCARQSLPFLYASSAATYGDGAFGYDDRESAMKDLRPLNPYGDSKLAFDLWAYDQKKLGHEPVSWAGFKFFNVYGFGERHKGSMASVVLHAYDQILSGGKVRLFRSHRDGVKDGEQKRDFIWVDDVVSALRFALEAPGFKNGIYNLGTGRARTFLDLARGVFQALGRPESIEFVPTPESIRDKYQYFTEAKMDKLRAAGYREPFTSLEEGIERTVRKLRESVR